MKLPTLLKSLQKEEYKEFEKFLHSPFFKSSEQYLMFFRYLCKQHPSLVVEKADLEEAYLQCFGDKTYSLQKLYNLLSGLAHQVEQYLTIKMVMASKNGQENPIHQWLLVRALGERNMGAYFRAEAKRIISEIEGRTVKSLEDYLLLQRMHHIVYFNPDTPKHQEQQPALQQVLDNLDVFYYVAKLRYAAEMKARERIIDAKYELPMLQAVLGRTADTNLTDKHPLLDAYNKLIRLYLEGITEEGFRALKVLFETKLALLPKSDQQALLLHLINMGISLGERNLEMNADMLALYKLTIEADALLVGGRITHVTFANIVACAALCKDFVWAKTFVQNYSLYLEDSKREATVALSNAFLHYSMGQLDLAQERLSQSVFTTPSFDVVGRGLLLKIAFERYMNEGKDYEFLTGHMLAFEKFVMAKPFTPDKKEAQLNCIRFARKLALVKFEKLVVPAEEKKKLRSKLDELQPVVSKKWLAEKIESL